LSIVAVEVRLSRHKIHAEPLECVCLGTALVVNPLIRDFAETHPVACHSQDG
jgi:hypothetical protein